MFNLVKRTRNQKRELRRLNKLTSRLRLSIFDLKLKYDGRCEYIKHLKRIHKNGLANIRSINQSLIMAIDEANTIIAKQQAQLNNENR